MDESKALSVLSALANGVNPATGEVFPSDAPYQSAEVIRALYVACRALESHNRPAAPAPAQTRARSLPANAGKPWKKEEDEQLLAEFDVGRSIPDLAKSLGRTPAGIQARLEKHGRVQPPVAAGNPSADRGKWRRPSQQMES